MIRIVPWSVLPCILVAAGVVSDSDVISCAAGESQRRADAGSNGTEVVSLEQGFRRPPDGYKPWAYWWWLKGNVTEESITRDLEEMRHKGISGVLVFDARGYHEGHVPPPKSRMEFMSPKWRRTLKFAMSEADRLVFSQRSNSPGQPD